MLEWGKNALEQEAGEFYLWVNASVLLEVCITGLFRRFRLAFEILPVRNSEFDTARCEVALI